MPNFCKIVKKAHDMLLAKDIDGKNRHIPFIVQRNKILSAGTNSYLKTDAFAAKQNYKYNFIHSELAAIKSYCAIYGPRTLSKCTLINIRVGRRSFEILNSRPCPACTRLIETVALKEVWYSTQNGFKRLL